MKFKPHALLLGLALLAASAAAPRPADAARRSKPPRRPAKSSSAAADKKELREIKVGVIYYDDFQEKREDYVKLLDGLTRSNDDFDLRLAVGTYDEVLEWYQKNLIDVAVMTPGTVGQLLRESSNNLAKLGALYQGSRSVKPRPASYAWKQGVRGYRTQYRAVAFVNEGAEGVADAGDLKRLFDAGRLDLIFVHQLSASGYILPRYALLGHGIDPDAATRSRARLTYSHDDSLRRLLPSECLKDRKRFDEVASGVADEDGRIKVAFVSDETRHPELAEGMSGDPRCRLRAVEIPGLSDVTIPQDTILISAGFYEDSARKDPKLLAALSGLLRRADAPDFKLEQKADWLAQVARVREWMQEIDRSKSESKRLVSPFYTLEQIVTRLNNYKRQHGSTRLALVLSGGGAKCAYQLGAIEAIENELERNSQGGQRKVDISLVVGTSGGAINALPVALGVSRRPEGQLRLREAWRSLAVGEFLQLWRKINVGFGLCLGLFQAALWMRLVLLSERPAAWLGGRRTFAGGAWWRRAARRLCLRHSWWLRAAMLMCALAVLQLPVYRYDLYLAHAPNLARSHNWLHVWSILLPALYWSAWTLLAFGLGLLLAGFLRHVSPEPGGDDEAAGGDETGGVAARDTFRRLRRRLGRPAGGARRLYVMRGRIVSRVFVSAVALTVAVTLWIVFLTRDGSFSQSAGLEETMIKAFPKFDERFRADEEIEGSARKLEAISDKVVAYVNGSRDFQTRDLVLTASRLPDASEGPRDDDADASSAPKDDLYFYLPAPTPPPLPPPTPTPAPARPAAAGGAAGLNFGAELLEAGEERARDAARGAASVPPLDQRFVSFNYDGNQGRLLDVVIGSSSIFPLYPPRPLRRVRLGAEVPGADVMIIDGGFAHNSPIEAAVLWQATHIIVIEATPEDEPAEGLNLWENIGAAFNYLYNQSQMVDARSRGEVEIFTLRPRTAGAADDPNSCLLDFSPRLVDPAIHKGYNDAMDAHEPRFRREPGKPLF